MCILYLIDVQVYVYDKLLFIVRMLRSLAQLQSTQVGQSTIFFDFGRRLSWMAKNHWLAN